MNPELYALSLIDWQFFASLTFKSEKLANEEIAKIKQTQSADQLKAALAQFVAVRDASAAREHTPTLPLPLA